MGLHYCEFCSNSVKKAVKCQSCGTVVCTKCLHGKRSSGFGKALNITARVAAGVASYGASEVAYQGYKAVKKERCLSCDSDRLITIK